MNTTTLPAVLDHKTLVGLAGTNIPPTRVEFQGDVYNGTLEHADNPEGAIEGITSAIYEAYEVVTRSVDLPTITVPEMAVALNEALERLPYGKSMMIHTRGKQPATTEVTVGLTPEGKPIKKIIHNGSAETAMSLPGFTKLGVGSPAWVAVVPDGSGGCSVVAKIRRRDQGSVTGLFEFVQNWVNEHSIYLGQCINSDYEFVHVAAFNRKTVAMTEVIERAMHKYVVKPILQFDDHRAAGMSLKTGILFEGDPGTGKTINVTWAEATAVNANITVIRIIAGSGFWGFQRGFAIARRFMKAGHLVMITMEDVEVLSAADRSRVLDLLDGGEAKFDTRIVLATTNNHRVLEEAFKRPGRWNAVIHCDLPDVKAFAHLVNLKFGDRLASDINWVEVHAAYEGYTYAFIGNALDSIERDLFGLEDQTVTQELLVNAGHEQRDYFNLLLEEQEIAKPMLDAAFMEVIDERLNNIVDERTFTTYDATDYLEIEGRVDSVIESRVHNAVLENNDGDVKFTIRTN